MANPWFGMVFVLAVFLLLIMGLRAFRHWRHASAELVRKLLHVGMGLVTLSLPWLFVTAWPVLLLAVAFAVGLPAIRAFRSLQHHLGGIIDGVDRRSLGELYFPLSVALVFLLSGGDAMLFCIPMLILTLADTAAALIGWHYGCHRFGLPKSQKSLEGSIAFFTVALLGTSIPLLLFARTGPAETLLIALTLALSTSVLEAIAWSGLDNLFIPLGGVILLQALLELDLTALAAVTCATLMLVSLLTALLNIQGASRSLRDTHLVPSDGEKEHVDLV